MVHCLCKLYSINICCEYTVALYVSIMVLQRYSVYILVDMLVLALVDWLWRHGLWLAEFAGLHNSVILIGWYNWFILSSLRRLFIAAVSLVWVILALLWPLVDVWGFLTLLGGNWCLGEHTSSFLRRGMWYYWLYVLGPLGPFGYLAGFYWLVELLNSTLFERIYHVIYLWDTMLWLAGILSCWWLAAVISTSVGFSYDTSCCDAILWFIMRHFIGTDLSFMTSLLCVSWLALIISLVYGL